MPLPPRSGANLALFALMPALRGVTHVPSVMAGQIDLPLVAGA